MFHVKILTFHYSNQGGQAHWKYVSLWLKQRLVNDLLYHLKPLLDICEEAPSFQGPIYFSHSLCEIRFAVGFETVAKQNIEKLIHKVWKHYQILLVPFTLPRIYPILSRYYSLKVNILKGLIALVFNFVVHHDEKFLIVFWPLEFDNENDQSFGNIF